MKHLQPYGKSPNECDMDSPTFCFLNCQVSFCQPIFPFSLILFSKNYTHDPAQKLVFCFPPTLVDSTEGMSAGGFGTLLGIEQTLGEYNVTISFLRLITTLVKVRISLKPHHRFCFCASYPGFIYDDAFLCLSRVSWAVPKAKV